MPELSPYPNLVQFDKNPVTKDLFCYVISNYEPNWSLMIKRQDAEIGFRIGDHLGKEQKLSSKRVDYILGEIAPKLAAVLNAIRINQAQFYFTKGDELVDVRLAEGKFLGPGMLKDLFGKQVKTQNSIEIAVINDEKLKAIRDDRKKYGVSVVLKPSKIRFNGDGSPVYSRFNAG